MKNKLIMGSINAFFVGALLVFIVNLKVEAGEADVLDVVVTPLGQQNHSASQGRNSKATQYRIDVTLEHADTGWEHYANRWDVLDENGKLLGERILHHPHVNEQPFTRSLTLSIPANVKIITIRAGDLVHGVEGKTMTVMVP